MNTIKTFLLLLISTVLFSGCATPLHQAFSKVHLGDDKSTVLEALGSPKHSVRENGEDRWTYRYYRDNKEYKRTLTFEKSKLIFMTEEEPIMDPVEILIEHDLESMSQEKQQEKQ